MLKLEKHCYPACGPAYIYGHFGYNVTRVAFVTKVTSVYVVTVLMLSKWVLKLQMLLWLPLLARLPVSIGCYDYANASKVFMVWTFHISCMNKICILVRNIANDFVVYEFIVPSSAYGDLCHGLIKGSIPHS